MGRPYWRGHVYSLDGCRSPRGPIWAGTIQIVTLNLPPSFYQPDAVLARFYNKPSGQWFAQILPEDLYFEMMHGTIANGTITGVFGWTIRDGHAYLRCLVPDRDTIVAEAKKRLGYFGVELKSDTVEDARQELGDIFTGGNLTYSAVAARSI